MREPNGTVDAEGLPETCATCGAACPVRTDTRAYIDLIARGRYEDAFEKIREFNPFPSVCGVICHHPCEQECRRQFVDEAVAIRNLKRFVVEQSLEYRESTRRKAEITHSETVGVVGSGPAGLTAAQDCIRAGYAVTVYESLPKPGGMLSCAIPSYRLPEDVLQQDIDDILALGIEIKTGVSVGKDISLDELQKTHSAVVLAIGLSESRNIPLINGDHSDVLLGLGFLQDIALKRDIDIKDTVIVIGGGNVAVDVARSAIRLGAKAVKMVCLENEEEMPAWDWEQREALEEGIEIVYRRGPTEVKVDDGRISGLVVREVERVFDEDGRFSPAYFDDRVSTIDGQMVIVSIGQGSDFSLVDGTDVEKNDKGLLVFDRDTMATSVKGIFACGEVVTGPGSAIEAAANGHRASQAVLAYLETGAIRPVKDDLIEKVKELPDEVVEKVERIGRVAMPTIAAEERRKNFLQFELGYDEKAALREARRCLSCTAGAVVDRDKCAACLTCLRVCPFGVPLVSDVAEMPSNMCQSCGLCAVECPALAISIKRFAVGDIRDRIVRTVQGSREAVTRVDIVCIQDIENQQYLWDCVAASNGDVVARIPVVCAARTEEVDMMKPFELGVKSVTVRRCEKCRYHGADDRLSKRVGRTQEILESAGIDGQNLTLE